MIVTQLCLSFVTFTGTGKNIFFKNYYFKRDYTRYHHLLLEFEIEKINVLIAFSNRSFLMCEC